MREGHATISQYVTSAARLEPPQTACHHARHVGDRLTKAGSAASRQGKLVMRLTLISALLAEDQVTILQALLEESGSNVSTTKLLTFEFLPSWLILARKQVCMIPLTTLVLKAS